MAYLLQQLLTNSATRTPDKHAVVHKGSVLTYGELNDLTDQLACTLIGIGVGRGDRVGVYLDKSVESVVSIFGIMKAGAAYVPLDPVAPTKRIAFIVENCDMKAVISTTGRMKGLHERLDDNSPLQGIILTDVAEVTEGAPNKTYSWGDVRQAAVGQVPDPHLIENDLAYILYTSGSTGTPKGVMISHRASLTFVDWATATFNIQANDRLSNHAPIHFDLSTFDIFTSMKAGATVVLVPPELSVFPLNLVKFIEEQKITVWYSVPSALTRMILYGNLHKFELPHLRTILFAGEVFPIKYLLQLVDILPHPEYHNLYGPTETNVCTWYTVPQLDPNRSEPVSIGKGCANSEIIVLDEEDQMVGAGEVGELCVRGPGLMSGYWGLPERTAKTLTPYTVHEQLGPELIYRTGDLVREEPDGNYTYLGRRDNQIKSRGYRIELGEIESALYSHPNIEEVATIPIPDPQIGNQIKAIIATTNGEPIKRGALEAHCSKRLPKYMVPHQFEFRSELPKTSRGKVDRTRLMRESTQPRN